MSKNYNNFYKPRNEVNVDDKREEIPAPIEEKQEEQKVEEVHTVPQEKPIRIYTTVLGPKHVNMRFKPSKKAQVINILAPGTKVEVLDQSNPEWTRIRYKDYKGYMMSEFLKKE
ncbi:MAG: SH3 domain-containing protein [Pseudobutyrivibrio sp.]|nr:SH3 domain-containing protein [Pseudobutyrivibrio sp.]